MEKKDRNEWTKKFRELGKKKGSHKDFAKLYKFFDKADIVKKLNGYIMSNSKYEKAVLGIQEGRRWRPRLLTFSGSIVARGVREDRGKAAGTSRWILRSGDVTFVG